MRTAWLLTLMSVVTLAPRVGLAQVSNVVRQTQYVFLVDDSGSMQQNDKNRLAVFSVRAMLSMLDDRDEVSVTLLNGPEKVPVAPLRANREALYESLKSTEKMASYGGQSTPCIDGFRKVAEILDAAARPGVQQVFFFLTDGVCEGGEVDRAPWEKRRASGDFDFYYLRFNERDSSPVLAAFAGDQNLFKLTAREPAGMIVPLAAALARSQGYSSYIIPLEKNVPAFPGSERVRVLAAAPDGEGDLELEVRRASGADAGLKLVDQGKFQFRGRDGRGSPTNSDPYQYLFGTYTDVGESTSYKAKGTADSKWKGVVVPEYRLGVTVEIHEGKCGANGAVVQSLGSGKDACFRVKIFDSAGKDVSDAIRRSGAIVKLSWAVDDKPEATPRSPSSPMQWTFEQPSLRDGKYTLRPLLFITGREDIPPFRGVELTVTVASQNVVVEPSILEVGALKLGETAERKSFKLGGNFEAGRAKFSVDPKNLPPACVKVRVADQDLSPTQSTVQAVAPGKEFSVDVSVPTWCGDQPLQEARFPILMQFEASGGKTPEAKSVQVVVEPKGGIDLPNDLAITVKGGESGFAVGGDGARFVLKPHDATKAIQLRFEVVPNSGAWPEEHLDAAFTNPLGDGYVMKDGAYDASTALDVPVGGIDLPLAALSGTCCKPGDFVKTVRVYPEGGSGDPKAAFHDLHVKVHVVDAGLWACFGKRVLKGLGLIVGLLLFAYLFNIGRNSHFLPPAQRLGRQFSGVMASGEYGAVVDDPRTRELSFRRPLGFGNRLSMWLKANPLRVGLPGFLGGEPYYETVHFSWTALTDADAAKAQLRSDRDMPRKLQGLDGRTPTEGYYVHASGTTVAVKLVKRAADASVVLSPSAGGKPVGKPGPDGKAVVELWSVGKGGVVHCKPAPDVDAPSESAVGIKRKV